MNNIKEILFESKNYALINRGTNFDEYAVVYGLDKATNEWSHTVGYYTVLKEENKPECLQKALDLYLVKTNPFYISKFRLEEIATKFKDRIAELDDDSDYVEIGGPFSVETLGFMVDEVCITDVECDFLGIDKNQFVKSDLEIEEV